MFTYAHPFPPTRTARTMPRRAPREPVAAAILFGGALLLASTAEAQTLRGGTASLDRQNDQARLHDFTYLQTPAHVRRFVEAGYLVPVTPNRDFDLHAVSFPYARPEVRLFIERLASQYRAACGERLVVTSLTRPSSNQPRNASSRSVHPTGMAVDLRRSARAQCRNWLESTLLHLEGQGTVEAIYERNPPHYHVAVYPQPYATYVARITNSDAAVVVQAAASSGEAELRAEWVTHTVRRGETLTTIARRYDTSVSRLQAENSVRGSRILVGQSLRVPVYRAVPVEAARVAAADAGAGTDASADARTAADAADVELVAANLDDWADVQDEAGLSGDESPSGDAGPAADDSPSADAGPSGTRTAGAAANVRPESAPRATPEPLVHRVSRGESLWTIARAYGVAERDLRAANAISGSRIFAGQELVVPGATVDAADALATIRHTVRSGESLWIIARRHNTTVDHIRRTNAMASTRIHPGQVLEVPVGR